MAWQEVQYRLTSDCPMLMHNGRLADPLDKLVKAIKPISNKRKKTDADHIEIARLEFLGGLYMGKDGPVIPAANVDGCILAAAKKQREGPACKSGFYCKMAAPLEYDGPRTPDELWEDERFRFTKQVRVNSSRIMRTRPKFESWAATVTATYEDDLVNLAQVDAWFSIAGTQIGLGDWRPQNGRFTAERLTE